jgi:hypothetical protein
MKDAIPEPARLRDRHDQPNLVERIAGQAARDSAEPAPLSPIAMARIAARIRARRAGKVSRASLSWALVMGAFLLGIATAASAAHLDLVPRWLVRIMRSAPNPPSIPSTPPPAKRRSAARREEATRVVAPALAEKQEDPPTAALTSGPIAAAPIEAQDGPGQMAEASRLAAEPSPTHRISRSRARRARDLAMLVEGQASASVSPGPSAAPATTEPTRLPPAINPDAEPPQPAAPSPSPPNRTGEGPSISASSREATPGRTSAPASLPANAEGSPAVAAPLAPVEKPPIPPAAAAPSSPPQTAGILKEIVRALRVEHAPSRALALLDKHASELAGQAFAEESLLLRVEAMMGLGERAAVLRLLDRTSMTELGVSRALLITRGELRAAANRCAEATGDFDLVLAESRRPPKPALLGRARCKEKLGDPAGAQADFDRYRREFHENPPR